MGLVVRGGSPKRKKPRICVRIRARETYFSPVVSELMLELTSLIMLMAGLVLLRWKYALLLFIIFGDFNELFMWVYLIYSEFSQFKLT